MHILIGLITAAAGLFWALNRLQNSGVNLNSFNPFFWARRRKWQNQLGTKPIHQLENPIDCASVLMVAIAKMDGDITREQKSEIITMFRDELGLSSDAAAESYGASSYMLQEVVNIVGEVKNILAPTKDQFERHQKESLLKMLKKIATTEGPTSKEQNAYITEVENQLELTEEKSTKW